MQTLYKPAKEKLTSFQFSGYVFNSKLILVAMNP